MQANDRLALIPPMPDLLWTRSRRFFLCEANYVLELPEYADFYRKQVQAGAYVILDNGGGIGHLVSLEQLRQAAEMIQPTEIVVPDFIGDWEHTASNAYLYLEKLG